MQINLILDLLNTLCIIEIIPIMQRGITHVLIIQKDRIIQICLVHIWIILSLEIYINLWNDDFLYRLKFITRKDYKTKPFYWDYVSLQEKCRERAKLI